jgi:ElaB/YqjD/DUF883 family membrane-anchored ribosome-binding protein
MKLHVKNINANVDELYDKLNELKSKFITNKDTHTFYDINESIEKSLHQIQEHFEKQGKAIMIIKGGL